MDRLKVACVVVGVSLAGACVSLPALLTTSDDYISLSYDDIVPIPQFSQKASQEAYQRNSFILEETLKRYKSDRSKYLGKVKHSLARSLTESIGRIESSISETQPWNKYFTKLHKCLNKKSSSTSFNKDDIVDVLINRARLISDMYTLHKVRENVENIKVPTYLTNDASSFSEIDTQLNTENNRYYKIIFREADKKFYESLDKLANKFNEEDFGKQVPIDTGQSPCNYMKETKELRDTYKNTLQQRNMKFEADIVGKEDNKVLKDIAKDVQKGEDELEE